MDVHYMAESKNWLQDLSASCSQSVIDLVQLQAEDMLVKHRLQSSDLMEMENTVENRQRYGGTLCRNDPNESVLGIVDREVGQFATQRMVITSARMCARWNKTTDWLHALSGSLN